MRSLIAILHCLIFVCLLSGLFMLGTTACMADDQGDESRMDPGDAYDPGDSDERRKEDERKKKDDRERLKKDDDDDEDRYSKLRRDWISDFIDTDFSKRTFRDLDIDKDDDDDRDKPDDARKDDDDHRDDLDMLSGYDDDDKDKHLMDMRLDDKRKEEDRKVIKELTKPIPGMLQDWVPAKVDRLKNGGFEKEPDNGFPVPYRLNGHLDIERKLPWEKEGD